MDEITIYRDKGFSAKRTKNKKKGLQSNPLFVIIFWMLRDDMV